MPALFDRLLVEAGLKAPPTTPRKWPGVYLLRAEQLLKIGSAADLNVRVSVYPGDMERLGMIVCASVTDARTLERLLHREFKPLRVKRNEWYRFDRAIVDRFTSHPRFNDFSQ